MHSTRNSFASVAIVIASLFWAQGICTQMFFPEPVEETIESVGNCHFDDADCFPTWVGIEQGVTEDGFPTLGSPDAPFIIAVFEDYGCVMCDDGTEQLLILQEIAANYVRKGQAQFWHIPIVTNIPMVDFPTSSSINSAKAALCAAEQRATWQYHQEIIVLRETEDTAGLTSENLVMLGEAIGLDRTAMEACMESISIEAHMTTVQEWQTTQNQVNVLRYLISVDGGVTWVKSGYLFYDIIAPGIEEANRD